MAKYIDADKAIEAVKAIWKEYRTPIMNGDVRLHLSEAVLIGSEVKAIIDGATKGIKCVPAADVVEVVRCKDCKYQDKGENDCEAWNLCGYRPWLHYPVQDEHYCGYGKRKD